MIHVLGGYRLLIERRIEAPSAWARLLPLLSMGLALLVGGLFLAAAGVEPLSAYRHILRASFGDGYALSDTLVRATPLLLCALGAAIAFSARLWNIGGEGQLLVGAWAATGIALFVLPAATPRPLMLTAMALAAMLAAAGWAGLCALLRIYVGVSELLSSLLLNYIALLGLRSFVFGAWSEGGFALTPQLPRSAWLPRLADAATRFPTLSGVTVHLGFVLGVIAALLLSLFLSRSRFGHRLRVLGNNPRAAQAAGLPVSRDIVWALLLSGALAGLAGMCEVSGVVHRLSDRFSPGYGFTALIVAWLARLQPLAIAVVAILFGGLVVGGQELQPAGIPQMLQGILLFVVLASESLFAYRLRLLPPLAADRDPQPATGTGP
jgi:simple sugar transport system permease protein